MPINKTILVWKFFLIFAVIVGLVFSPYSFVPERLAKFQSPFEKQTAMAAVTSAGSRILNDNASRTPVAAEDINVTNWNKTSNFLVTMGIQTTSAGGERCEGTDGGNKLQFRNITDASSTWINLATSTGEMRLFNSVNLVDANALTSAEAQIVGSEGTYADGFESESNTAKTWTRFEKGAYSAIQIAVNPANALDGKQYQFRFLVDTLCAQTAGTNVASVNITLATAAPSISSAANQTFTINDATTSISTISVTSTAASQLTAANDIRIKINTSTTNFRWDTTDTLATLSGNGASKASTTVSYADASGTLVINVTTDFAANDNIQISGLSYKDFNAVNTATTTLRLFKDGASDAVSDASDDKTVVIKGKLELAAHSAGQETNKYGAGGTISNAELFNFQLLPTGENASTTLIAQLSSITGIVTGDITSPQIFVDTNANGNIDAGETTTAFGDGTVSIGGGTGTISFTATTSTVVSATSTRYILKATTTSLVAGDSITFGLGASNITADGQTSKVRLSPVAPSPPANATHTVTPPLPGAPGTPTYTNISTSTLTASWTSATNADYYKLERALTCGTFTEIATTTALTRNDSGLATSTSYCYRVRGTNAQGDGSYSASSSVTTSGGGFSPSGSLVSLIIDTAITAGVAPNSLFWEGSQPANTTVKFQFAASNATSGPWTTYVGWNSSANSCDSSSFYTVGPATPIEIKAVCHQNKRYIRYKVFLETTDSAATPRVDRIILNYAK